MDAFLHHDDAACQTSQLFKDIYLCLVTREQGMYEVSLCPYVLPFGGRYYCRHADRELFAQSDGGNLSKHG